MGDISAEPSMEDILSSIKRIIAEDGDAQPVRPRRAARPAAARGDDADGASYAAADREILELNDPAPEPGGEPDRDDPADPIVSPTATQASRGSLDALTRMIARPDPEPAPTATARSMDDFVAELLRPLLRDWLDAHLPDMVEGLVAKEIARITGGR